MGNVYSLDAERSLILYSSGKNIYLRSSSGEALTRAVSLTNDYAGNLSDIIYQGTVFYAYQNTQQDIIIKNITDPNPYYKINNQDTPDCLCPYITVFQNMLMLFYLVKNPLNEHLLLKCVFPDHAENRLQLTAEFSEIPVIHLMPSTNHLYIQLYTKTEVFILQLDEKLQYCQLFPHDTLISDKAEQYEKRICQLSAEHTKELNEQQLLFENRLKEEIAKSKKELSDENEQLRSEINKYNAQINSAKRQYDELMNTALKYRNEALKWRNKFVGD